MVNIGVDIDGTVFKISGGPKKKVQKLVRQFIAQGHHIVFITLRPQESRKQTHEELSQAFKPDSFTLYCRPSDIVYDEYIDDGLCNEWSVDGYWKSLILKQYDCSMMIGDTAMVDGHGAKIAGIPWINVDTIA